MGSCVSREKNIRARSIEKVSARAVNGQLSIPTIRLPEDEEDEQLEYKLPSTEDVTDRTTLQHELFRYIWQNNFSSPVDSILKKSGTRVLDVGCGSGAWVLDMAKTYSLTTVTGIDCDQLFPSHVPVPNANFNICNIVNGLPFDDNTFDFVHQRFLGTTFTEKEWTEVIPELVRVTKPGGWIELMEMDIQGQNEGMSAQQFTSGYSSYLTSRGILTEIRPRLRPFLESSNLMNVQTKEELHPVGTWEGRLGEAALFDHLESMKALKTAIASLMGMNEEEYLQLVESFRKEADLFQTYWVSVRAFGMKPTDKSVVSGNGVIKSESDGVKTANEDASKNAVL